MSVSWSRYGHRFSTSAWAVVSIWLSVLLLPVSALAQGGATVIFGQPCVESVYDDNGNVIGTRACEPYGTALTCAAASASAAQGNTGRTTTVMVGNDAVTSYIPGLQGSSAIAEKFPDAYLQNASSFNPMNELVLEGLAARPAPSAWTSGDTRVWADAPAGSGWVTSVFEGEPPPTGPETLYSVFMGAWYIPTEADAKKMRVKLTYRADDALIGVYLNDITANGNLLTAPITRDTSSVGTEPATIELKGFQQGTNLLSFVVSSTQGANQDANYPGFAAAFDAYCFTPPPAPVPTTSPGAVAALMLLLGTAGAAARKRRRRG